MRGPNFAERFFASVVGSYLFAFISAMPRYLPTENTGAKHRYFVNSRISHHLISNWGCFLWCRPAGLAEVSLHFGSNTA
jgi:hypothetical protein